MNIDMHVSAPKVRLTPLLVVVAIVIGLGSLAALGLSAIMLANASTAPAEGYYLVPVDPSVISSVVAGWTGVQATLAGTAVVPVWVTDVPPNIANEMAISQGILAGTYLLVSLIGLATAIALLARRLKWKMLAPAVFVTGLIFAIGSSITQIVAKSATESLSALAQSNLPTWTEPGFGVAIDLTQPAIGAIVMSTAVLFGVAGRLAQDADGVV